MKRIAKAFLLLAVLVAAGTALAQDIERYLPRLPRTIERSSRLPEDDPEVSGDPTIIGKELKALIFVEHPDLVDPGPIQAEGVQVRGGYQVDLLRDAEFQSIAWGYIGGPISMRRLNTLARDTILYYRRSDRPVVDVSIPEQDITDGVVQIVVREAVVGRVVVEGAHFFNPCMLANQTCIQPGDVIYESLLMEDLRWLNRNPYREVDVRLRPGEYPGETDVVFDVDDRRPLGVYAGYEDTGTRDLGIERTIYGLTFGNVLRRDHQAGYQYTTSSDFERLRAHSGVYVMRLPNRNTFSVYGSYAEVKSQTPPFDLNGFGWQAGFRYDHELYPGTCCPRDWVEHHLTGGFDFKRTNTNLEFGGAAVFTSPADLAQLAAGYYGSWDEGYYEARDEGYLTYGSPQPGYDWASWGVDLVVGLDGFSTHNNDASLNVVRQGAKTDYVYVRGYLERQWALPWQLRLVGRASGQFTTRRLLPSEQLNLSGFGAVRGYDTRAVNGDSGVLLSLELRSEPIPLLCGHFDVADELQLLGFCDYGDALNRDSPAGEDPSTDLAGLGVGLRYRVTRRLALRSDYAWQLKNVPGTFPQSSRWHVSVVLAH